MEMALGANRKNNVCRGIDCKKIWAGRCCWCIPNDSNRDAVISSRAYGELVLRNLRLWLTLAWDVCLHDILSAAIPLFSCIYDQAADLLQTNLYSWDGASLQRLVISNDCYKTSQLVSTVSHYMHHCPNHNGPSRSIWLWFGVLTNCCLLAVFTHCGLSLAIVSNSLVSYLLLFSFKHDCILRDHKVECFVG